jgi:predicted O-methyltransferase YrrM
MTVTTLTPMQRFMFAARELKSMLGLPVSYRDHEFSYLKGRTDWSRLPAQRISMLSNLFCTETDAIRTAVEEAEAIAIDQCPALRPATGAEIGNPMGTTDRITLYVVIRLCKPIVAVETGSAAGASAIYILTAMEKNRRGILYSIDSAVDRTHLGCLVPEGLRGRLSLRYGNSLTLIPEIAGEAGAVEFFLHDSLHTYAHMTAEYELFFRHMATSGGVICSHDILMSNAWDHFIKRHRLKRWGALKNLGICRVGTSAESGNHQEAVHQP